MQSASLRTAPGIAWERARQAVPAATLWSALIVFLLILTIAKSAVAAAWVPGVETYPMVALAGALLMGVLGVTPLPWWWCVSLGMALGPVVAGALTAPAFRSEYPLDPSGLALIQTWIGRVQNGAAFADSAFVVFVITWLMWVTGAWLSWCVLRWRQPLTGLTPGAAAFATNVLNSPDQNTYTLAFLVLTFALLLWTNYTGSIANAAKARVKLTGDARWDFWESGLVATAALIVLAIMLPPLSTQDRTQSTESSLFSDWAQLQQQLNRPDLGTGTGKGGGTTGVSTTVSLSGPLKTTKAIVFTYTVTGQFAGPKYFRFVNVTVPHNGEWTYQSPDLRQRINKGDIPDYGENYKNMALATFGINMIAPPPRYPDVLFYPGQLYRVDRDTIASEVHVPPAFSASTKLVTIDRLSSLIPPRSNGNYNITVMYPDVLESDLRTAGTDYPTWLSPYRSLPAQGYRPPDVMNRVHNLALQLTAGMTNPYDEATAIQDYLRSGAFRWTLKPPVAPAGTDALDYFLFSSPTPHEGYCQYFATAMGDMLRSLGIPTRLVNGYGAGTFDTATYRWVVRDDDSHTWVESYFPGYGWIPFEPTNDGTYSAITRGTPAGPNLCLRDNNCNTPTGPTGPGGLPIVPNQGRAGGNQDAGGAAGFGPAGFRIHVPDATTLTRIVGILLALLLLLGALIARYLRPRTVAGAWKRTLVLARLAGADVQAGETPLELSRRLSRVFPEAAPSVRALAGGFVVAAYAPSDLAQSTRSSVMEAWTSLRPLMLKRVAGRFRPGRT
jgi:transglutaminase-like putative cysteine protease